MGSLQEFMKSCRLCSVCCEKNIEILERSDEDINLPKLIWKCLRFQVKKNDHLPKKICGSCVEKLCHLNQFVEDSRTVQQVLMERYRALNGNSSTSSIRMEDGKEVANCDTHRRTELKQDQEDVNDNETCHLFDSVTYDSDTKCNVKTEIVNDRTLGNVCCTRHKRHKNIRSGSDLHSVSNDHYNANKAGCDFRKSDRKRRRIQRSAQTIGANKRIKTEIIEEEKENSAQFDKCKELKRSEKKTVGRLKEEPGYESQDKSPKLEDSTVQVGDGGELKIRVDLKQFVTGGDLPDANQVNPMGIKAETMDSEEEKKEIGGVKLFKCDHCAAFYKHRSSLMQHKCRAHGDTTVCEMCSKEFPSKALLIRHVATHVEERVLECPVCKKRLKSKSSLKNHLETHSSSLEYCCHFCGKVFRLQTSLFNHLAVHKNARKYSCHVCGKGFRQGGHLKEHLRLHSGIKPYSCSECEFHFTTSSQLKRHKEMHQGIKKFFCDICNKSFLHKQGYDGHMLRHEGKKPVECEVCQKKFVTTNARMRHMRTHTGEKPFKCRVCDRAFAETSNLRKHTRTHDKPKENVNKVAGKTPRSQILQRSLESALGKSLEDESVNIMNVQVVSILKPGGEKTDFADVSSSLVIPRNTGSHNVALPCHESMEERDSVAHEPETFVQDVVPFYMASDQEGELAEAAVGNLRISDALDCRDSVDSVHGSLLAATDKSNHTNVSLHLEEISPLSLLKLKELNPSLSLQLTHPDCLTGDSATLFTVHPLSTLPVDTHSAEQGDCDSPGDGGCPNVENLTCSVPAKHVT